MPASMHKVRNFKGHPIYSSANTHPKARTKSLIVFSPDRSTHFRFRYVKGDAVSFTAAISKAVAKIKEFLNQ